MMTKTNGQVITKKTYEDPDVVEGFIRQNAVDPKNLALIKKFAEAAAGKKVLDLGCGPGHESYIWADLGFEVTGLDYSGEMIKRAKTLRSVKNMPRFLVGDMRKLTDYFEKNYFDVVWANASILHIRKSEVSKVLRGINYVGKNGAKVLIRLKGGDEDIVLVKENRYGKHTSREYSLWQKDEFLERTEDLGWQLEIFLKDKGREFLGKPTEWLMFCLVIRK